MPVAALFFPIEVAIAMTAIVHLANNFFKLALLGRHCDLRIVVRFGLPATGAAFFGAFLLGRLSDSAPLWTYALAGRSFEVTQLGLGIGLLILLFVGLELSPRFASLRFDPRWLPLGGLLSGFFGGLSGHQGAFRSLFLLKAGLSKEAFVATGVVIAVLVDLARVLVYGGRLAGRRAEIDYGLVSLASLSAFAGAYLGARLLSKVTIEAVRRIVAVMLVLIALALMSGVS